MMLGALLTFSFYWDTLYLKRGFLVIMTLDREDSYFCYYFHHFVFQWFDPVVKQKGIRINVVCPLWVTDKPVATAQATRHTSSEVFVKAKAVAKGICR